MSRPLPSAVPPLRPNLGAGAVCALRPVPCGTLAPAPGGGQWHVGWRSESRTARGPTTLRCAPPPTRGRGGGWRVSSTTHQPQATAFTTAGNPLSQTGGRGNANRDSTKCDAKKMQINAFASPAPSKWCM